MSERSIIIKLNQVLTRLEAIEARLRQDDDDLVDIKEASRMLGKLPCTIRQMVCRGQLDAEHAPERRGRGYALRFRRGKLREYNNRTKPITES